MDKRACVEVGYEKQTIICECLCPEEPPIREAGARAKGGGSSGVQMHMYKCAMAKGKGGRGLSGGLGVPPAAYRGSSVAV